MTQARFRYVIAFFFFALASLPCQGEVRFNRDVRPILAEKCFVCHGPDAAARKANLRLDEFESAVEDRGGYRAITPKRLDQSVLIKRILSRDSDERMPPVDSGLELSAAEIKVLEAWIAAGAKYEMHWAFLPLRHAPIPKVAHAHARNSIDHFVASRLGQRTKFKPAQKAHFATQLRRVSLALTGLPPSLAELDEIESTAKRIGETRAYEQFVDRLLASSRFGEHWAVSWLDAARYADTNGYFTDEERTMWRWRDWVIDALNRNMPFDRFTIEQLAGDLLPGATIDQKIATGFNRNHMINNETGIVAEEFRLEYVADRAETTATVWLGLTLGCARCHDHKYDPLTQIDFYQFFAYFNNLPEQGESGSAGNSAPLLSVPTAQQTESLDRLKAMLSRVEQESKKVETQIRQSQKEWESKTAAEHTKSTDRFAPVTALSFESIKSRIDGSVSTSAGIRGKAVSFTGTGCLEVSSPLVIERDKAFSIAMWIKPGGSGCVISKTNDPNQMRGFDLTIRKSRALVNLVHEWNRDSIQVQTAEPVPSGQWNHFVVTYDGSSKADGLRLYLNGERRDLSTTKDKLTGSISTTQPWRVGRRRMSASFKGGVDELRMFDTALSAEDVQALALAEWAKGVITQPVVKRSSAQREQLRSWFLQSSPGARFVKHEDRLAELRQRHAEAVSRVPTTMVMQEQKKKRVTKVLIRGSYDRPGESVQANVPSVFRSMDKSKRAQGEKDRLALANWIVDRTNPLTARVAVNRMWAQLFGVGLVKTVDDFGTQGELPTHPDLLDWLAMEFQADWDIKRTIRMMVCSHTFRQTSGVPAEHYREDPENRWLARGPRFRLSSEAIRDSALSISGLLISRPGGPSVKPYQPKGLWKEVTYDSNRSYNIDLGEALYRRSVFTYWKRQAPPLNMRVFDAPTRETCVVQRSRTNTPLQALVVMNDPTFLEAARRTAEVVIQQAQRDSDRLKAAFRRVNSRVASDKELKILRLLLNEQRSHFRQRQSQAAKLVRVGASQIQHHDSVELASWMMVVHTIMCLDEAISQP